MIRLEINQNFMLFPKRDTTLLLITFFRSIGIQKKMTFTSNHIWTMELFEWQWLKLLECTTTTHSALTASSSTECYQRLKKLFELFDENNSPTQAKRIIEEDIMCHDNYLAILADGSRNPTTNALYYLHSLWSKENFGNQNLEPLAKIKEKMSSGYYKAKGNLQFLC